MRRKISKKSLTGISPGTAEPFQPVASLLLMSLNFGIFCGSKPIAFSPLTNSWDDFPSQRTLCLKHNIFQVSLLIPTISTFLYLSLIYLLHFCFLHLYKHLTTSFLCYLSNQHPFLLLYWFQVSLRLHRFLVNFLLHPVEP